MTPGIRTIVYIDGFNLYYGALKGGPHKWLDLERYCKLVRPNETIQKIRYYTARAAGPEGGRQAVYLKALDTLPLVEIALGRFKAKTIKCRVQGCTRPESGRFFNTPEEKRTDVTIGVQMLDDAYQGLCNQSVLVSGDSDLVPALNQIKTRFPKHRIVVYVPSRDPARGAAVELRTAADRHRLLPLNLFPFAQLPASIPDGAGGTITKPPSW